MSKAPVRFVIACAVALAALAAGRSASAQPSTGVAEAGPRDSRRRAESEPVSVPSRISHRAACAGASRAARSRQPGAATIDVAYQLYPATDRRRLPWHPRRVRPRRARHIHARGQETSSSPSKRCEPRTTCCSSTGVAREARARSTVRRCRTPAAGTLNEASQPARRSWDRRGNSTRRPTSRTTSRPSGPSSASSSWTTSASPMGPPTRSRTQSASPAPPLARARVPVPARRAGSVQPASGRGHRAGDHRLLRPLDTLLAADPEPYGIRPRAHRDRACRTGHGHRDRARRIAGRGDRGRVRRRADRAKHGRRHAEPRGAAGGRARTGSRRRGAVAAARRRDVGPVPAGL